MNIATAGTDAKTELQNLANKAFDRAKLWSGVAHALQILIYLAGAVAVLYPKITLQYPWIALPLAAISLGINTRANSLRSDAEMLKRNLESFDGFGFPVEGRMLADLRQKLNIKLSDQKLELLRKGNTYASDEPVGAKRAAQNLAESTWYSKQLSKYAFQWLSGIFVISLLISISLLLYSAISLSGSSVGISASRCVAATLIFIISGGILKALQGFHSFAHKAEQIDNEVSVLITQDAFDTYRVKHLLGEYQLARAQAPLIPTFVWKIHRKTMNQNFKLRSI